MIRIVEPRDIGFCPGVKNAVSIVERGLATGKKVYCYGEIVHNPDVVLELETKGLKTIYNLEELLYGETVIIRAHGVPIGDYVTLQKQGAKILDATCPKVRKAQEYVKESFFLGRQPVVIGKIRHPEVIGLAGQAPGVIVVNETEEARSIKDLQYIGVIIQTTYSRTKAAEIVNILKNQAKNCTVYDTLCGRARKRQEESRQKSSQVDVMIIIGGKNSSNTAELADCCREVQKKVYIVENETELNKGMFDGVYKVGVTGGLSTPYSSIEKVKAKIQELKPF